MHNVPFVLEGLGWMFAVIIGVLLIAGVVALIVTHARGTSACEVLERRKDGVAPSGRWARTNPPSPPGHKP